MFLCFCPDFSLAFACKRDTERHEESKVARGLINLQASLCKGHSDFRTLLSLSLSLLSHTLRHLSFSRLSLDFRAPLFRVPCLTLSLHDKHPNESGSGCCCDCSLPPASAFFLTHAQLSPLTLALSLSLSLYQQKQQECAACRQSQSLYGVRCGCLLDGICSLASRAPVAFAGSRSSRRDKHC